MQNGKHAGVVKFTKNLPKKYSLNPAGNIIGEGVRGPALGVNKSTIWGGGRLSNIYISKAAFADERLLFMTIGHEYVHAYHNFYNLISLFKVDNLNPEDYSNMTEFGARSYNVEVARVNGWLDIDYNELLDKTWLLNKNFIGRLRNDFLNAPVNLMFRK